MNIGQATDIQRNAIDAANAIDRTAEVIATLPQEDRSRLARHLGEIIAALHFGILAEVYDRFPELRPDEKRPVIDSLLRWEDVSLPALVTEADLDALLFSVLESSWRKTAVIIGKAMDLSDANGWQLNHEMLGARLRYLAYMGRIESQGDLSKWRHSEVRLGRRR